VSKFKLGDELIILFDENNCTPLMAGDIVTVIDGWDSDMPEVRSFIPGGRMLDGSNWYVENRYMAKHNKRNWCRVFLEMMNEQ